MTAINQVLRLWLHRASPPERGLAAVALVIVLGLLGWAFVPNTEAGSSVTAGGPVTSGVTTQGAGGAVVPGQGATASGAPVGAVDPVTGAPIASGVAPGAVGGASPADLTNPGAQQAGGCRSGSDTGVSQTELNVAISIIALGGAVANSALGVPPPEDQRASYEAVIGAVNAAGGIGCRQVIPRYTNVNPIDTAGVHQACLDISASQPYVVIDNGALNNEESCFASNQIPVIKPGRSSQAAENYPYLLSPYADDLVYRNATLAWQEAREFDSTNGFNKLGILYRDCIPALATQVLGQIKTIVGADRVTTFNLGCPSGFASPSDQQQAVLTFQREQVSHLLPIFVVGDFGNFTRISQTQGFRPRYLIADNTVLSVAYGASGPNWENIDGASVFAALRWGEEHTPGFQPTAATQQCDAILTGAGLPPSYEQQIGFGGFVCGQMLMLQAAFTNAPSLARTSLIEGLLASGQIDLPYPAGPADFSSAPYGGQFFRPLTASAACSCFMVIDPNFRPSLP